jgi:hypothetical protein
MRNPTRRSILKVLGAGAVTAGALGSASAKPKRDKLRLFSEEAVSGTAEVVTQKGYAYVAKNGGYGADASGMAVVDWKQKGRPETVAEVALAEDLAANGYDVGNLEVKDVKVDGDVVGLANDTESPGGAAFYDVSDPANPTFLSFYEPEPSANIHNLFVDDDHAYLTLGEPENVDTDGDGERNLVRLFGDTGLEIVDISDPQNPTNAATWYLKEELPDYAQAAVNPNHDIYVQDGLAYNAFWDAGVVVLDVSDPTSPEFITQFGAAPQGNEVIRPWNVEEESIGEYYDEVGFLERYYTRPGNAHYVRPSPDGNYAYVGAETFPQFYESNPETSEYGGIKVFDTSDLGAVEQVGYVSPPDVDGFRTSHNFDVTNNRLHTSWYEGGVRVYDVTDPANPDELGAYDPDGYSFWAAVTERGMTVGSAYGGGSAAGGGLVFLSNDRGKKQPPAFEGGEGSPGPQVESGEGTD